jgi:hypothetical protein
MANMADPTEVKYAVTETKKLRNEALLCFVRAQAASKNRKRN